MSDEDVLRRVRDDLPRLERELADTTARLRRMNEELRYFEREGAAAP